MMDWNSCVGRGERGDLAHGDDGEDGLQRGDVVELFVDDLDGLEADVEVAGDATEVRGEEISRLRIEARHVSGVELVRGVSDEFSAMRRFAKAHSHLRKSEGSRMRSSLLMP